MQLGPVALKILPTLCIGEESTFLEVAFDEYICVAFGVYIFFTLGGMIIAVGRAAGLGQQGVGSKEICMLLSRQETESEVHSARDVRAEEANLPLVWPKPRITQPILITRRSTSTDTSLVPANICTFLAK